MGLLYQEEDYRQFLGILKLALIASGCYVWAYALMSNHYHLMLYGSSEQITKCLRRLNYLYSKYHNRLHNLTGHAFDGPYQAFAQPTPLITLCRIAYIFLNPVTAGLVGRAEDYPWSGYLSFMGLAGSPMTVESMPALNVLDQVPDRAREEFKVILERESARQRRRKKLDRISRSEVLSEQFQWLLDEANRRGGIEGWLPTELALAWGEQCGIPPRVMASTLGDANSGRVRHFLYNLRNAKNPRQLPPPP